MNISSNNTTRKSGLFGTVLLLPSFLCLDAPLVAISWSTADQYLQRGFLSAYEPHAALFLVVWGIYLFDRLHDTRPGLREQRNSLRHRFALRHRGLLLSLFVTAFTASALLVFTGKIVRFFWAWGTILAIPVLFYFVAFRFFSGRFKWLRPLPTKEITIGLCFAAGVCLASGSFQVTRLVPLAILFLLNCLIIARAEAAEDRISDPAAFYSSAPNEGTDERFNGWEITLAVCSAGAAWLLRNEIPFRLAVTASAIWLMAIPLVRAARQSVQSLADAALLTPWPVVAGWLFFR